MLAKLEAIMPLNIDSTMITCWRSCEEKFRDEFIYGLRPPGLSIDLHAGACFATALEVTRKEFFTGGKSLPEALLRGQAAFEIAWGGFEIPEFKKTAKTKDNMWKAVEEYFAKFPPITDHLQPYIDAQGKPTFEFTFAIPLEPACNPQRLGMGSGLTVSYDPEDYKGHFPLHPDGHPWLYSGRLDMLGKYEDLPCAADEKTTGRSISTGWADQWNLRNQFMGYKWALNESGIPVRNVIVRGISIMKTIINFAEAVKDYPNELLARWKEQLRCDLWHIRRAWDLRKFEYNFAEACTSFGNCIFMDACSSANPEGWLEQFEVRRWNPILKNPTSEAA